ncbi:MAG: hypothetical protein ABSD99_10055 [Candidatus Bathyarchaeia archaeon]
MFAVSAVRDMIMLKKLEPAIKPQESRTLKLIGEAWHDIDRGRYKIYPKKAFFKEFKKW